MHETTRSSAYGGLICAMILVFAATAFPLDNTKIKGVIVGRAGADVIVRTQSGNVTVTTIQRSKW